MKKLVYISHNVLGYEVLKQIFSSISQNSLDLAVELVISRNPSEKLSDQMSFSDICSEKNVELIETSDLRKESELVAKIKNIKPDFLFVFGWSQIIPQEIIDCAGLSLGTHPALLPKNRGNAAIPWTILLDEKETAMTLFELKGDVDSGRIVAQRKFEVSLRETSTTLYEKCVENTKLMLREALPLLVNGQFELKEQEGEPSYLGRRKPETAL